MDKSFGQPQQSKHGGKKIKDMKEEERIDLYKKDKAKWLKLRDEYKMTPDARDLMQRLKHHTTTCFGCQTVFVKSGTEFYCGSCREDTRRKKEENRQIWLAILCIIWELPGKYVDEVMESQLDGPFVTGWWEEQVDRPLSHSTNCALLEEF